MIGFDGNSIDRRIVEGSAGFHSAKSSQFAAQAADWPTFCRVVILSVIHDPTTITTDDVERLENDVGVTNAKFAHACPRNTIVGRRITDGSDASSERAMLFFPFLPSHVALPCKPGEHVWVMFESSQKRRDLGWWLWRVNEPHFVDDVNHTHAPRSLDPSFNPSMSDSFDDRAEPKYEFRNGRPEDDGTGQRYTVAESAFVPGGDDVYERLLRSDDTLLVSYGAVPRFKKRPGDVVLEGSNNTLISLGTDRAGAASGIGGDGSVTRPPRDVFDAGAIDIVAGRGQTDRTLGRIAKNALERNEIAKSRSELSQGEGDPDLINDRARVYVAQATRTDENFGLKKLNATLSGVSDSSSGDGAVIVSADKIRLIARSDVEIVATGFKADKSGRPLRLDDENKHAVIVLKSNGDIIIRPGKTGSVRIGDENSKQRIVLGDELMSHLTKMATAFNSHTHAGQTVVVAPPPAPPSPVTPAPPSATMETPSQSLVSDFAYAKKSM